MRTTSHGPSSLHGICSLASGALIAAMGSAGLVGLSATPAMAADAAGSVTFGYTGTQEAFTVPQNVSRLHVHLLGGTGGDALHAQGGAGGDVLADLPVGPDAKIHAGDSLVVTVAGVGVTEGAGGYNGGGVNSHFSGLSGTGGGASDVRLAGNTLEDRIVVAAGGGGAGWSGGNGGDPGRSGGTVMNGSYTRDVYGNLVHSVAGGGATATQGGTGDGWSETEGVFGRGGDGGHVRVREGEVGGPDGGGGGGGWYGGGGAAGATVSDMSGFFFAPGGGGGSSYAYSDATDVQIGTTREAPSITLSWTVDTTAPVIAAHPAVAATAPSGAAGTAVSYDLPTADDAVEGSVPVACTPASGSTFPVGRTAVTCSAADAVGNTATSTFDVVVTQAAPPVSAADLKVAIAGPATVKSGTKATYTLTVSNAGPAAAVKLDSVLAVTGLGTVSTAPAAGTGAVKIGSTAVSGSRWTATSLASGASVTYAVSGTVTAKAGKTVALVAAAGSSISDPVLGNNLATTTIKVS